MRMALSCTGEVLHRIAEGSCRRSAEEQHDGRCQHGTEPAHAGSFRVTLLDDQPEAR
jgi:hypothetical protein